MKKVSSYSGDGILCMCSDGDLCGRDITDVIEPTGTNDVDYSVLNNEYKIKDSCEYHELANSNNKILNLGLDLNFDDTKVAEKCILHNIEEIYYTQNAKRCASKHKAIIFIANGPVCPNILTVYALRIKQANYAIIIQRDADCKITVWPESEKNKKLLDAINFSSPIEMNILFAKFMYYTYKLE